ncbi:hypothetical protein PspCFBP13508_03750 [Pseudomonas sp. CFBP13508]|uniref:hypothetical protein n=1 Tax=Pseudomonas sp. CFBP13508 TaxID=2184009 RepID=UPI0010BFE6EB|nr:hypothetical protein [Pseudomonas sp. CFBP13508]TKJ75173.1 hypothetical protein PspCFBP13508_03750 [Pseudomonas sp. CFBP13508]
MKFISADVAVTVDRSAYDKQERALMARALTEAIAATELHVSVGSYAASASRPSSTVFNVQDRFMPRVVGSSFDERCEPARNVFKEIINAPAFLQLLRKHSYADDMQLGVNTESRLFIVYDSEFESHRFSVAFDSEETSVFSEELDMLAELAEDTGGVIYSGEVIGIEQWLNFHGYNLPTTLGETRVLIEWLVFELPEPPILGDYHELLHADQSSPFHLSIAERHVITQTVHELTRGATSLLQAVAFANFNLIPAQDIREHADKFLQNFLRRKTARALGVTLHERLGWHLEADDSAVRDRQLDEIVLAALIIDMQLRSDQPLLAGYDFYQPANSARSAAEVRILFEQHLVDVGLSEAHNAPLAAHLLLAGAAPELLIAQIPPGLTLDKPGWVTARQTAAVIEHLAPGSCRAMTFAQIKAFSELTGVSTDLDKLYEAVAIPAVVDWAVLNGVISYRSAKDYDNAAVIKATAYFSRYMQALAQSETGLSATPPDRRKIALQALEKVMPAGPYLEQKAFKIKYLSSFEERSWLEGLKAAHPAGILSEFWDLLASTTGNNEYAINGLLRLRLSILDLYLSGDLVENGKLSDKFKPRDNFRAPAGAFARLGELQSPSQLFDQAFDGYYRNVREGLSSLIKMAITQMPEDDRLALTRGKTTLYTVRKEVNPLNPNQETQIQRDEAHGRYGIILCCGNGDQIRAYELFTLRGVCRERPDLALKLQSTGLIHQRPTLSYTGSKYDFQDKNKASQWPLDYAAYREGSESRPGMTSKVVVEKLWQLQLDATDVRAVALFFSAQLDAIAECVLDNHPVASRDELYAALDVRNGLEEWRTTRETIENLAINVIVPFKQCVEDIRSGRTDRVSEGIGGCVLDGLSVIGLLVGLGASAASILAKTGSTTLKLLKVAKAVARAAVSLANPLDGVPALARKGFQLARRGVVFAGASALDAAHTASVQLKRLMHGADGHDWIRLSPTRDVYQATWRGGDALGEGVDIAVLERNQDWHALNIRTGGAWGPRLKLLDLGNFAPLKRLFGRFKPFSYTRGYLKKAIPVARSKLDNSISALMELSSNDDIPAVLRHVFGNDSDEVVEHVSKHLRAMRRDLESISFSNVTFRPHQPGVIASLSPPAYKRWKTALRTGKTIDESAGKFLSIYPDNLDEFYKLSRYDDGSVADVLIHEMSHGGPDTLDLYYGQVYPDLYHAEFDAVGLLELARDARKAHPDNLINPHHALAYRPGFVQFDQMKAGLPKLVQDHPALANAESYMLAVSLLDQAHTRPAILSFNIKTIEYAVSKTAAGKFLKGPLLLNLAKPVS